MTTPSPYLVSDPGPTRPWPFDRAMCCNRSKTDAEAASAHAIQMLKESGLSRHDYTPPTGTN
jgi:hypothetical protein